MARRVMFDESDDERFQVACKECERDTNHVVLRSVRVTETELLSPQFEYQWTGVYQIIECQGCDTISFRSVSSDSEDVEPDKWFGHLVPAKFITLYPSRIEGRSEIDGTEHLPMTLRRIYRETLSALNGGQPVLAGIGLRVIIETVARKKKAAGHNLSSKINDLKDAGVLTKEGADILHRLRLLGNRAAHEVKAHSDSELNLAIDVVEHLLQAVYVLPFHAQKTFK